MGKLDWSKVVDPSYGPPSATIELTENQMALLLLVLNDRAIFRGSWVVGDDPLTDAEWEEVEALIAQTNYALMPVVPCAGQFVDEFIADIDGWVQTSGDWNVNHNPTNEQMRVRHNIGNTTQTNVDYQLQTPLSAHPDHRLQISFNHNNAINLTAYYGKVNGVWQEIYTSPATTPQVIDVPVVGNNIAWGDEITDVRILADVNSGDDTRLEYNYFRVVCS